MTKRMFFVGFPQVNRRTSFIASCTKSKHFFFLLTLVARALALTIYRLYLIPPFIFLACSFDRRSLDLSMTLSQSGVPANAEVDVVAVSESTSKQVTNHDMKSITTTRLAASSVTCVGVYCSQLTLRWLRWLSMY